jgi:hypothetical protein
MAATLQHSNKNKIITTIKYILNGCLVIIPFVLLLLPKTYFDEGESVCLSMVLFNFECYGCGMTRAIMHLIHFDFQQAWEFNKLSFLVLPLLFPIWLKALYAVLRKTPPKWLRKIV